MSKNNLTRLYEDYPLCFGDGLELGDDISRISEEEKSRNCEPKKRPKMKKSTLPVEITGINDDYDGYSIRMRVADYFSEEEQRAKELDMIENTIPEELKEINASRYENSTIESRYKQEFQKEPVGNFARPKTKSPPPAMPSTNSAVNVIAKPKKKKQKINALLEGLKKNAVIKNETNDACDITSSSVSSESSFHSTQTSSPDEYLTGSESSEVIKPSRKPRSTSKRLSSKFVALSISDQKPSTSTKKDLKYEPCFYKDTASYEYKAEEFPAL